MPEPLLIHAAAAPRRRAPRRVWWLLATLALGLSLGAVARHWLDPWLRRQLETQVARQTHGQYRLHVAGLETNLWQRAVRLRGLHLRPAAPVADTLPRLRLDVARLHVTGIGLLALLRRGTVPLDSVVLDSVRLHLLALPRRPGRTAAAPLHQRLPLKVAGLEINYLGLLHAQASYGPAIRPTATVNQANAVAHNLFLSAAGAADTQRLAYATAWQLALRHARAEAGGHHLAARQLRFSTQEGRFTLDSLGIAPLPDGQRTAAHPSVKLELPRLALSGFDALALRHQRLFRADSLLVQAPRLAFGQAAQPVGADWQQALKPYLRRLRLTYLGLHDGQLRLTGTAAAPVLRGIQLTGTGLRVDSSGRSGPRQVFFAESWQAALGPSEARAAGHHLTLGAMRLSTRAGTFSLSAVRIVPPALPKPGAVRVDLTLPRLAFAGWQAGALAQRQLRVAAVQVQAPRLVFTPPTQPPPPIWQLVGAYVRRTDVGQFQLRNATVQIGQPAHPPVLRQLNVTGTAIRIDSAAALDRQRIAYARAWEADAGYLSAAFDAPFYQASSQHVHLNTAAQTLRFDGLALTPAYSPVGMNLHKGYQAPAIAVKLKSLAASGVDFGAFAHHGRVQIARVLAQRLDIHIASDGRGPINPSLSKVTPETIRLINTRFDIRELTIGDANLYSRYRSPRTPQVGTLNITRFSGTFRNLSNDPRRQTPATPLTAHATAYLQNRCRLEARLSAYLLDPQGRHQVWGSFGPGAFALLNDMTVPTRLVQFKQGQVHRIRFALQADKQGVSGTMRAEYAGLQLSLLSYKQDEEEIKKSLFSRLKSKVANVIAIRDRNPRRRGKLVEGQMTSRREPRFSVFTLWRQGLVSGLFHSVGLPQPLAQSISEQKDEAPLPK